LLQVSSFNGKMNALNEVSFSKPHLYWQERFQAIPSEGLANINDFPHQTYTDKIRNVQISPYLL
jgi:hypothetical protein